MSASAEHGVEKSGRFRVVTPISAFEKADGPEDRRRRIGGLISTESVDRDGEVVLQRGLNFQPFLDHGWFNDNHKQDTGKAVGIPTDVHFVKKGTLLPNGQKAPSDGHWAEGYLLRGHPPAEELWSLATSLAGESDQRRLGFSIEGRIRGRAGQDGRVVAAADIFEVAVTRCPVNTDTRLDILGKSLGTVSRALSKSADPIGDMHKEPDGDEKNHSYSNPDAAYDSEEEQIRSMLGGVEGVVNQLKGDFGFPGNNVGLGMGDPQSPHVDPIHRAMTTESARPLIPSNLRQIDKSVASTVIEGILRTALVQKQKAPLPKWSGEVLKKASASIVDLALAAETKESFMTVNKNENNSLEAIAKGVLDSLQTLIKQSPDGRRQELLSKAGMGQLSGDETEELTRLLKGGADGELSAQVGAVLGPPADIAKSQRSGDATQFLLAWQDSMAGAVSALTESIEKSDAASKQHVGVIAKGLLDLGEAHIEQAKLIKGLEAKLDQLLSQPAYAPKSSQVMPQVMRQVAAAPQGVQAGIPGNPSLTAPAQAPQQAPQTINKSQVLDLMIELSSRAEHGLSKSGLPWGPAITLYETDNTIAHPLLMEVQEFYRAKQGQ